MSSIEELTERITKLSKNHPETFSILNVLLNVYSMNIASLWLAILENLKIDGRKIEILHKEICSGDDEQFIYLLAILSKNPNHQTIINGINTKVLDYLERR